MITINTILDMRPGAVPKIIHLSQYDSDFSLVFRLHASFGTLNIESGTTAEIRGTKKSGTGYSASATLNTSNNTVTVTGDAQMTAVAGQNIYEIVLIKNNKVLGSANFILLVERAALDADTITDATVLRELNAIIEGAETATQAAEDAEDAADRAEAAAQSLVIDSTPTQGSSRAVSSGGVYDEIAALKGRTLSYGARDRILKLFENAIYKSPELKGVCEELRELLGVKNIPYTHLAQRITALNYNIYTELGHMELNAQSNSKRGLVVSTQGERTIPYNDGTESPYYPILIPKGVNYITWLNAMENDLAATFQVLEWDSTTNLWKRIMSSDYYYSNLDGSRFYFDVSFANDGEHYFVSAFKTADGEHEFTPTQFPSQYEHTASATNQDVTEASLKLVTLEFV